MAFLYCPECRAEYLPGVLKCADCGVPLVRELPAAEDPVAPIEEEGRARPAGDEPPTDTANGERGALDYIERVCVFDTFDFGSFLIARSLLEGAGIPIFPTGDLQPFHGASSNPGLMGGGGRGAYRLLVDPELAEDARAVLASWLAAKSSETGSDSPDDDEEPSG